MLSRRLQQSLRAATSSSSLWSTPRRHCGFLAAVHFPESDDGPSSHALLTDPGVMDRTTALLHHRGPDGRHLAKSESSSPVQWSMGHQRLAIVDPLSSTADMPFVLQFGATTVQLVANGEIYNHDKLYDELVQKYGWNHPRHSHSDCEVIAHALACVGVERTAEMLDGMFAFTALVHHDNNKKGLPQLVCARDPVGIKPLYKGTSSDGTYVMASELKALTGHVVPGTVQAVPAGHYWTPETGLKSFYSPEWLYPTVEAPWKNQPQPSDEEIREAFQKAVKKRMMSDVDYGFFLSGGVDSCIVAHTLMPAYRHDSGDDRPLPAFTVGMEDSPDLMAAKAMVEALGGSRYIDHRPRIFTASEVMDLIPKIVYHMETYEAELIRSAIPNWLLAERAGADVKMVLTGEGADELFAGYLYFMDATTPEQVQNELRRIYGMLGNINLHRTDRMTMAHGLEARVPFLDTEFTKLVMSVDPRRKMIDRDAVAKNAPGREKTMLRELFSIPNENGDSIPRPVLWRAKAMQCEGVGEDWVSQLQRHIAGQVSDAELEDARLMYPLHTPQTKEEVYYRRIFDEHFPGLSHVVHPWEGGCRAAGAAWDSDAYTREGLQNTGLLTHAFQKKARAFSTSTNQTRSFSSAASASANTIESQFKDNDTVRKAIDSGFDLFEAMLTHGGDDRSLINPSTGKNKYHIHPKPLPGDAIFRGSCTCNAPTSRGYDAAVRLYETTFVQTPDLDATVQMVFDEQRSRIAKVLDLPDGAEIILCPSGSDAEYMPIAIARAINPMKEKLVNIVTQVKEIGAGSSIASGGRYFSTLTPLVGEVQTGDQLEGLEFCSEVSISARERDGSVVDATAVVATKVKEALANGSYPIVHGVFGGKTGLCDAVMPGSGDGGELSLGVVDACQGRFNLQDLHTWLSQDSLVLFTGSKFYQAPPFCGAIIIPPNIAEKLRSLPPPEPISMLGTRCLGGFFTDKELPECMNSWKPLLRREDNGVNVGLALRWEAGLAGMESVAGYSNTEVAVKEWAQGVTSLVQEQDHLDPWCVEHSIISIRLRRNVDGNNSWRGMDELREVYRLMSLDLSKALPPSATKEERRVAQLCCHLGQPVDVAESHAILRIALGSESLREYLDTPEKALEDDDLVVRKLNTVAKYFEVVRGC